MRQKGYYFMRLTKKSLLVLFLSCIFILGITIQEGSGQYFNPYINPYYFNPYYSVRAFTPWVPGPLPAPQLLFPPPQLFPAPMVSGPSLRYPNATIILGTGITAVSPATGILVIGAPTVVLPLAGTAIVAAPTAVAPPAAPAPLLSILVSTWAADLYFPQPLSIANPLLFAYISSLII